MTTKTLVRFALILAVGLTALATYATTYYVYGGKSGGSDSFPGTNWTHPKATIQAAISVATNGDLILVTNGIYSLNGGMSGSLSNRVVLTNSVTVQSVNGPKVTFITGTRAATVSGTGTGAVRCAYLTPGSYLIGFTLTNGATLSSTMGGILEQNGGGVYCEDGAAVFNCIITGNTGEFCGGTWGGSIENCIVSNNYSATATISAAGVGGSVTSALYNCLVVSNRGGLAGACYQGTLVNCTVTGNITQSTNCAVGTTSVFNSIVYYNTGDSHQIATNLDFTVTYSCTPSLTGTGNITNAPGFVSPATGDYHLGPGSPCVDAIHSGNYTVNGTTDLDGLPRVFRAPDMGCYERQIPGDINNDGVVDANDLKALLTNYTGAVDQQAVSLVLSNYWPNTLLLNMTNVAGLGGTNVTFALTNSNAGAYSVQYSTDLNNWQTLGPAVPSYLFTDTNGTSGPMRYYRLSFP